MNPWAWLCWLVVVVASGLQMGRSDVATDVSSFLPGPATAAQRLLVDQVRDGLSTRSLLIGLRLEQLPGNGAPSAAQSAALLAASQALRAKLAANRQFAWVSNGDLESHGKERGLLFSARYLLSPAVDARSFSQAGLSEAFARLQEELVSARAGVVRTIAPADPTLASLLLLDRAAQQFASRGAGPWLGGGGTVALLLMETRARGGDIDGLRQALASARSDAQTVLRDWPAGQKPPLIEFAGASYFNVLAHDAIGKDAHQLALLALALVAALLWWALRSPRFLALALLPVATGTLAGFAMVGSVFHTIHGITLAFGVTLIGEAVDYAIYAYVQADDRGHHTAGFWRQVVLAVLTSLVGFAAMILSGFAGLQQLGLFSIAGLIVAACCTRWLLPPLLRGRPEVTRPGRFEWLPALCQGMRRLRVPLLVLTLACMALLVQRRDAMWQDSLDALSSSTPAATARDLRFRSDVGVPDLRTMVTVNRASMEQALQSAEAVGAVLDGLVESKVLDGFSSPAGLVPSRMVQEARRAALPEPDVLRARLVTAARSGNLQVRAFDPFLADVAASRAMPLVEPAYYAGTILGAWLDGQLVRSADGVTVLILLRGAGSLALVKSALQRAGLDGVAVVDLKSDVEAMVARYRERAMRASLAGTVVIFLLLAWQLRRARPVVSMVATIVSTVAITSSVLLLRNGQLSVFNLVSLLLVVGVASNYTLFFSTLSADPVQRQRASVSVMLAAGSTFLGFSTLALSSTPVLATIGLTVSIGTLVGLLSSIVFSAEPVTALAVAAHRPTAGDLS